MIRGPVRGLLPWACLLLVACAAGAAREQAPPPAAAEMTQPEQGPLQPSRSCRVDADCAVRNVGNCCGYFPACVNRAAPTFPDKVKAACERDGLSSVCGFVEINACRCVENHCEAAPDDAKEVM